MKNLRITFPDGRVLWIYYLAGKPTPVVAHVYTFSDPYLMDQTHSIPFLIVGQPELWSRIRRAIHLDISREQLN
jgi:hypothetical protein